MTLIVTAMKPMGWSFYNYMANVSLTNPASGSGLSSVVYTNDRADDFFDSRLTVTGSGITTAMGAMTAGNVTALRIATFNGAATYLTLTVSGAPAIGAAALQDGFDKLEFDNDTSGLDAIFRTQSYLFTGSAGDDFFEGSNVADTLNGGFGFDVLIGFDGSDLINGGPGDDLLDGYQGNNTLNGGDGDDYITAGTGANIVSGGRGEDTIDGSFGVNDTLTYAAAMGGIAVALDGVGTGGEALGDRIIGIETVIGSAYADTITSATALHHAVSGGSGNDIFTGVFSGSTIDGGSGNDTLNWTGIGLMSLSLASGQLVTITYDTTTVTGIENATTRASNGGLSGTDGANRLQSFVAGIQLTVDGLGGADTLIGSGDGLVGYFNSPAGVSIVLGSTAPQVSAGHASGDVLSGFAHVFGSPFADTIQGTAANNDIFGVGGNDLLYGSPGADTLDGGSDPSDTVSYVWSPAAVTATAGAVSGNAGGHAEGDQLPNIENLTGSAFNDTLGGSSVGNALIGNGGNDSLTGLGGGDGLNGGAGKDTLDGGAGTDLLIGGADRDSFVFSTGYERDTIIGFQHGIDRVDLGGIDNLQFYSELLSKMHQVGANLEVDFGNGDVLVFDHMTKGQLTALDFVLS